MNTIHAIGSCAAMFAFAIAAADITWKRPADTPEESA